MTDMYLNVVDLRLVLLVLVALVALLLQYVLRLRRFTLVNKYASWQQEAQAVEAATHEAKGGGAGLVSIIIPVNERCASCAGSLVESLFKQKCDVDYEIILADEGHSECVRDLVERGQKSFGSLRYTFVPETVRYIEVRKLAITLGVKAARGEWVLILDAQTLPLNDEWLHHFVQNLSEESDMVQAYYNYEDNGTWVARRAILDEVDHFVQKVAAWDKGVTLDCGCTNWAMRKSAFMAQHGFADSVSLPFGEEAILANLHVGADRLSILCAADTRTILALPHKTAISNMRVQRNELIHHLTNGARKFFIQNGVSSAMLYVMVASVACYAGLRVFGDLVANSYSLGYVYTDALCVIVLVAAFVLPLVFVRKTLKTLGERRYGAYIYLYYLLRPFHTLATSCVRWENKSSFVRKFI